MDVIKGQNLRLTLNGKYFAYATDCSLHVSKTLEDSSSKDSSNGLWQEQTVTGKSFDLSANTLFSVADDETGNNSVDLMKLVANVDDPIDFTFDLTEGENNRTRKKTIASGKVILNDGSVTATNKANGTYSLQAQGFGKLNFDDSVSAPNL